MTGKSENIDIVWTCLFYDCVEKTNISDNTGSSEAELIMKKEENFTLKILKLLSLRIIVEIIVYFN